MRIYSVNQGMMTASGAGDMASYGVFTNKKEAVKHVNSIKKDLRGYNKPPHGYLLTTLELYEGELNKPMDWDYIDAIEVHEFRWWR